MRTETDARKGPRTIVQAKQTHGCFWITVDLIWQHGSTLCQQVFLQENTAEEESKHENIVIFFPLKVYILCKSLKSLLRWQSLETV